MLINKFPLLVLETTEKWGIKNLKYHHIPRYCKILLYLMIIQLDEEHAGKGDHEQIGHKRQ